MQQNNKSAPSKGNKQSAMIPSAPDSTKVVKLSLDIIQPSSSSK